MIMRTACQEVDMMMKFPPMQYLLEIK
uniref:Uncharacterized protein n=1 Tax=Rhizophora mucronata TaxID=61149 RepID=A0A2P2NK15_RHIMU